METLAGFSRRFATDFEFEAADMGTHSTIRLRPMDIT